MEDISNCTFYGWYRSPLHREKKMRRGLFHTWISETPIELLFYSKNDHIYEFFTKEDITDLFAKKDEPGMYGLFTRLPSKQFQTGIYTTNIGPYILDPATFADLAQKYNAAKPREISHMISRWRERIQNERNRLTNEKTALENKKAANVDWLKKNL